MITNRNLPNRPGYPQSLQQSVENPTQPDRLPLSPQPTLKHRLRMASPLLRRAVINGLAFAVMWRLLLVVVAKGSYLLVPWMSALLFYLAIIWGVFSVSSGILMHWNWLQRWLISLLVATVAVAPVVLGVRLYYLLALAFVALTLFAERLATHYFAAHLPNSLTARSQQKLFLCWKNRFAFPEMSSRTIAWYLPAMAIPLAVLVLMIYWSAQPAGAMMFYELSLLFFGALALWGLAWSFSALPQLFADSQPGGLWQTCRITLHTLWDWLSYNPRDIQYPLVFQSPAGPIQARQAIFLGTTLLLATSFVEIACHVRPHDVPSARLQPESVAEQPYQRALRDRYGESFTPVLPPEPTPTSPFSLDQIMLRMVLFAAPHSILAGVALVPVYLLGSLLAPVSRAAAALPEGAHCKLPEAEFSREQWHRFVEQMQASPDPHEHESLFLGLNAADHSPVVVPRRVFQEHAHILGDSGSGKTALGISPLVSQLIRSRTCSVVLVDLKGDDHALFENARLEAERAGLRFRWFTNELGNSTYAFNPMAQRHLDQLSLYQRTDLLTASLGLQYGTDYGRGYFSDANAEMLFHALRAQPKLKSFSELALILRQREPFRPVSAQIKAAGAHLSAIVSRLAATEALNVRPARTPTPDVLEQAIDMQEAFQEPQVIFFHLSSALGTSTTAEIARMAMFSLLTASKFVSRDRYPVFLVVDEFQRVVSNNLELFLQTARSMDIGVILANQSLGDLRKPDADIVSTVRTNTRYRQLFSVGEKHDLEEVIFTSGETLLHGRSWQESIGLSLLGRSAFLKSRSTTEVISPRLRINDILLASDHPQQSIAFVRRGDGYAQFGGLPFVMNSTFHISAEEYKRRKEAPWPPVLPGTFAPTRETTDQHATMPVVDGWRRPAVWGDDAPGATYGAASSGDGAAVETETATAAAKRLVESLDQHYAEQQAGRTRSGPTREAVDAGPPSPDLSNPAPPDPEDSSA